MPSKKLLFGCVMAGAVIISALFFVVQPSADERRSGPYQIASQANTGNVWVLDTRTGALRLCLPPHDSRNAAIAVAVGSRLPQRLSVEEVEAMPSTSPVSAGPECLPWGNVTR